MQALAHQCLAVCWPTHHLSSAPPAIQPALPNVGTTSNLIQSDSIIITTCEFGDDVESFCNYSYGKFNFASVVDASDEILNYLLSLVL